MMSKERTEERLERIEPGDSAGVPSIKRLSEIALEEIFFANLNNL
jgi:hypothetical protein